MYEGASSSAHSKPLPPVGRQYDADEKNERDHSKNGYSLRALEDRIRDCVGQPDYKSRCRLAHSYYDMGKQISPEKRHKIMVQMGIDPKETNLIHGVINSVLGMEAKQRNDVRVEADDDEFLDVSDVLSMRMKEATRESNCDMAVSNAYAGQCKGGIGWVEVSLASDPLDYPYRVTDIHYSEISYDWRAKDIGLNDASWMIRSRWEDLDESCALMPEFSDVLERSVNNNWDLISADLDETHARYVQHGYGRERNFSVRRDEWCDSSRKRIKFFEVWYRVPAECVVIHIGPTRRLVYDENNPIHQMAVNRGVKVSKSTTRQMRMALFAGPHRLIDVGTTRRMFPYVPFFAFRDDQDGSPYGLIDGMIGPQDSYNERRTMVDWMLRARQTTVDNDALDSEYNTISDIRMTASRPDFFAVLNAKRTNARGISIDSNLSLQAEQLEVMMNDKQTIQDVPRIYSTQLGDAPAGVTSGVAINSLTEAGAVAMGELNDNYRYARKMVHEQLLDLIIEDHLEENLQVMMGTGQSRRTIVLNTWTPEGQPLNRVKDSPVKIGFSEIPNSPAFRMQEQQQIAMLIQAMQGHPAALNILGAAYIDGSSATNRKQLADDFRRATGQSVAGDRQAQAAAQEKQQAQLALQEQLSEAVAQLELQTKQVDIAVKQADIQLKQADVDVKRASLSKTQADIEKTDSEVELNNAKAIEIGHDMGMSHNQSTIESPNEYDSFNGGDKSRLIDEAIQEALSG